MSSLGDCDDVRHIGGQLGKERNLDRRADPAANIAHELRVLKVTKMKKKKKKKKKKDINTGKSQRKTC